MKCLSSILFAVLFVTGVLIAPALHQAYCANEHGDHDVGNCAICQIAHTPLQLSEVILAPVDCVCPVEPLSLAARLIPPFTPRAATQARAPPA
jgi:hypothetical protein